MSIRVLLADDHGIVREGLRALLEKQRDIEVVGEAEDGRTAVQMAQKLLPDVIIMDITMPDLNGVEATRQVKNVSPRSQIVVLTSYHEDEHIFPALEAGATSYILKDVDMDELAEAIRRAARGDVTLHPRVASRVLQELHGTNRDELNPFTELTKREMEVLRLIAQGRTNAEIATELVITERTVKAHVSNLLGKLHLSDRTQAAVYAWREGLMKE